MPVQITITLPDHLYERVATLARLTDRTIEEVLVAYIEANVTAEFDRLLGSSVSAQSSNNEVDR